MKTKKYDIYSYWSDKAITKSGEVKRIGECTDGEEAVKVTELPDEIFCWACQCPALPHSGHGEQQSPVEQGHPAGQGTHPPQVQRGR